MSRSSYPKMDTSCGGRVSLVGLCHPNSVFGASDEASGWRATPIKIAFTSPLST